MLKTTLISIILISIKCYVCGMEFYSSPIHLELLVQSENNLIEALEDAVGRLEEYLTFLKKSIPGLVKHDTRGDASKRYISNPINVYKLMKRLTIDVDKIRKIHNNVSVELEKILNGSVIPLPSNEDFDGITELIGGLQYNYDLNMEEFAEGFIKGVKYGEPLDSEELYHLGVKLCEQMYLYGMPVLNIALERSFRDAKITPKKIIVAISEIYLVTGNYDKSLEWDNWYLKEQDGDDIDFLLHKAEVLTRIKKKRINELQKEWSEDNYDDVSMFIYGHTEQEGESECDSPNKPRYDYDSFVGLCKDALKLPVNVTSRFKCHYKNGKDPFLRLAPLKLEELFLDPEVYMIHDLVSEDEAAYLREISKDKLGRAKVMQGAKYSIDKARVSSALYLPINGTYPRADKVFQRSLDLADLIFTKDLFLQINNYGVGGHYSPHHDYFSLSDVEAGGATAFPYLGIGTSPKTGRAIYWKNLHSSGEGDVDTLHGACPVLLGSKWAANVWVYTKLQRPHCDLEYRGTSHRRYLSAAIRKE